MKTHRIKSAAVFILLTFTLTGCFAVDGNFINLRNKVLYSVNEDLDRDVEFAVGAAGIRMGSLVVSFSESEPYVDDMIRKLDRVQIGVYNRHHQGKLSINYGELKRITSELRDDDYEFIVRTYDQDGMTAVMVKKDSEYELNEMFIIAFSDDQLVLAQFFGDLDGLIEIALREQGFKFDMAKN